MPGLDRSLRGERAALDGILRDVQRPARYIGGEWNEVVKDHRDVAITFALGFPDVYENGMSHLGYRILYSLLNEDPEFTGRDGVYFYLAECLTKVSRPAEALPYYERLLAEFEQSEYQEEAKKRVEELKAAAAAKNPTT